MSVELDCLVGGAALSLSLALLTVVVHYVRFGGKTIRSNRDAYPPLDGHAGRVVRAHASLNEALLPFAIVVLAATSAKAANPITSCAALVFLGARLAHAWAYLLGLTPWRSLSFYVGVAATIALGTQLPIAEGLLAHTA